MADLIYAAISSLDGYVADEHGEFDWAAPDEEVHAYVNALERSVGTYLYGRRMYDTMVFWETEGDGDDEPAVMHDYTGIWRAADKVVFSRTLDSSSSARTRIEREFDPVAVRALVDAATDRRVDRWCRDRRTGPRRRCRRPGAPDRGAGHRGRGTRALPDGVRLDLELVGDHRFASGFVHLHYRVVPSAAG